MVKKKLTVFLICGLMLFAEVSAFSPASGMIRPDTVIFIFNNFSDLSMWQLNNDAHGAVDDANRHVLRMTESVMTQSGSAFIREAVPLVGDQGFKASFSAFFSFRMHEPGGESDIDGRGADGIVFVVQTVANNVGSNGGGIGYQNIPRSVGIEFDNWENLQEWALDPDGNHVGIDTGGSVISVKTAPVSQRLNNSAVWYAWVDYDGDSLILEVRLDTVNVRPVNPILVDTIDLKNVLMTENAFVGFTGGTGSAYCSHDILSFKFINTIDPFNNNLIDDQTFSVMENSPAGTLVGTVATNPGIPDPIYLSELAGVPEFDFNPANREITVANGAVLDYELQNLYRITLQASKKFAQVPDTVYDTATITINILDTLELPDPAEIDSAVIYDANGDGIGDSVLCLFTKDLSEWQPNKADLEWPDNNAPVSINLTSSNISGNKVFFSFTPANNAPVLTKGAGEITAFFDSVSTSIEKNGPVYDGIGPLLKDTAYVVERFSPGVDTFLITFTEEVNVNDITGNSFILLKGGNEIILSVIGTAVNVSGEIEASFVSDLSGLIPEPGDSLKILYSGPVIDKRNNSAHRDNTPVPIAILNRIPPVKIVKGFYFDNEGNGYVDSIYVEAITIDTSGNLTDAKVKEIVDNALTFPAFRSFTVYNSGVTPGGFFIRLTEDKGHTPVTYVTQNDEIVVVHYVFSTGGEVEGGTVPVYDRVAPIIHGEKKAAFLVDYMNNTISDTLTVKFSEPINRVTSDEPFYFLDRENNTTYEVKLSDVSHPDPDKMVFYVTSLSGVDYMEEGDSLWIKEIDHVGDIEGNYQNNNKNTKCKLYVKKVMMPYSFIPKAVSPIDLTNMHTHIIPNEIISVLQSQGILGGLNLQQNNTGSYTGMLIMVVPYPNNIGEFLPDLELEGKISVFDAVGNQVVARSEMAWWNEKKSLVYVWNVKNENSRTVGPGVYLSIIELEDITESLGYQNGGPKEVKKLFIGVRE